MSTWMDDSLEHVKVKVSPFWHLKEMSAMTVGKVIHKFPPIGKAFRFLGHRLVLCGNLGEKERKRQQHLRMIKDDDPMSQKFGSSYGYTDEVAELIVAYEYHQQLKAGNFKGSNNSESEVLYRHLQEKLSKILSQDKNATVFLNFGVSYAHIDSLLAKAFPQLTFVGIDRSNFTRLYNERSFQNLKNMEFLAGDIFDLLEKRRFDNGVFFHTRTLCLLSQSFIEKLYASVAKAGFKYIVGVEQVGISRETFKPYEFSNEVKPSVLFRDKMFIHNYPGILKAAGFVSRNSELLVTNHPDEDYRLFSFVGEKKSE